jgi:hypothetical protein
MMIRFDRMDRIVERSFGSEPARQSWIFRFDRQKRKKSTSQLHGWRRRRGTKGIKFDMETSQEQQEPWCRLRLLLIR